MTTTPTAPNQPRSRLGYAVGGTVTGLQEAYLGRRGEAAAARSRGVLADLRRHAGRPAEDDVLSLEKTLGLLRPPLSDEEIGSGDRVTPSEAAAYAALTLFALHIQSATAPVHVEGQSFARACGRLAGSSDSQSIAQRFDAMVLARDEASRQTHIRSLVTLLRSKGIGFDYGRLAWDLRSLGKPERRNGVLLWWSRDFALALRPASPTAD